MHKVALSLIAWYCVRFIAGESPQRNMVPIKYINFDFEKLINVNTVSNSINLKSKFVWLAQKLVFVCSKLFE